jgi:uncharacterized protein (DUF1800 family)
MVDMLTSFCIVGVAANHMVEMLMMMFEMSMMRCSFVGWFEDMCIDWFYP